jgi:RNA polymerase sigma-70 factor (ECF subfamily)
MHWPEEDIFDALRNGDRNAFNSVFKQYYSGLCTFANDYIRSYDLAEEIVQEVFLNIWENRHKIHINISLKAYLYRSVHNHCLNFLRNNMHWSRNTIQLEELKQPSDLLFIEIPGDTFDTFFTEKIEQDLEKAIEALPEQCKTIFCLSRYENIPYPEIAKQLGVSLSTVKTQMSRAMHKIREIMDDYFK